MISTQDEKIMFKLHELVRHAVGMAFVFGVAVGVLVWVSLTFGWSNGLLVIPLGLIVVTFLFMRTYMRATFLDINRWYIAHFIEKEG